MLTVCLRRAFLTVGAALLAGTLVHGQEPALSESAKTEFLLNAKVVKSERTERGVTRPWRLTLTDGNISHAAAFQSIDDYQAVKQFATGRTETNYRDSYHFNIAAYEVAKLLGLDSMVPVTVERKWDGKNGALAWWIPFKWHEMDRIKLKLKPPDLESWERQVGRTRLFVELIGDTDRNLSNLLITEDWKAWMIDFTRAFRLHHELQNPGNLTRCDRQLLENLRRLNEADVVRVVKEHLRAQEIGAVMARREKLLRHFDQLLAQKGADQVLY